MTPVRITLRRMVGVCFFGRGYRYSLYRGVRGGSPLRSILSRGGHLPVHDALGYSEQLLGALQYSHSMGIIHRDIKPANIMVLERTSEDIAKGQPGQIKVMDFGISRAIEEAGEALTKANVVMVAHATCPLSK